MKTPLRRGFCFDALGFDLLAENRKVVPVRKRVHVRIKIVGGIHCKLWQGLRQTCCAENKTVREFASRAPE